MTVRLRHHELLRRIRARDLASLQGRDVVIRCARLSATEYRDIADLALAWAGAGSATWHDGTGATEQAASGPVAASRLARQALWHVPRAWIRHRARLGRLGRMPSERRPLGRPGRMLYLRTDQAFDLRAGGSVTHTAGVVNGLRAAGVDVEVVSTDTLPGIPDDDRFHVVTPNHGPFRNTRELSHLEYDRQLRGRVEAIRGAFEPDLVYHRHSYCSAIGPWLRADWGVPLVLEYNGSVEWVSRHWEDALVLFPGLLRRAERLSLAAADLVVAVSEPLREDASRRGVPPDRIVVEPNAVDAGQYRPDADDGSIRARYGIPADAVLVGFIGTFGPWHGARVLARAAARLAAERDGAAGPPSPDIRFLLIGDGVEMPMVRRIIDEAGIEDRVVLPGLVPQDQGPAHLAACDILTTPQVPNPDGSPFFGSPTKLFEYMATGRAIVASDLDQIGRVIEHGRTGFLVPPGDVDALAAATRDLGADPDRRARLGAAARERVLERHTWDRHVERILAALEVGGVGGPTAPGEVAGAER